jgi:hypothetical protein
MRLGNMGMKTRGRKRGQTQASRFVLDSYKGLEETQLRVLATLSGVLKYVPIQGGANRYDTKPYDRCH